MKLTKCDKGHFYDADKYNICPHCEKQTESTGTAKKVISEKPGAENSTPASPKRDTLSPHTGSIWEQNAKNKTGVLFKKSSENSDVINEDSQLPNENKSDNTPNEISPPKEESEKPSLQSQVNAVTSQNSVDTKTIAKYDIPGTDIEPVVGWLVCVKGAYIGQSFNLKIGRNTIGRAMNMNVPLAQETSVSRNTHAVLTYEPQKRVFYIQAGESGGLTYLNGEVVMTFIPAKAYDKIQLGDSEFIFIPCCGEMFTWEDYIK